MLLQILDYLKENKIASNQQIAREFKLDVVALEPMLNRWLAKGKIALCQTKTSCQSACFKCKVNSLLYYQFVAK